MPEKPWVGAPNLPYLTYRLIRRILPPGLTHRLASRDQIDPRALADESALYPALLEQVRCFVKGAHVLEIGPGTLNPFSLVLLPLGARHVTLCEPFARGFDPAKVKVRLSTWKPETDWGEYFPGGVLHAGRIAWKPGPADALPLENESVDVVLSNSVWQFIPDMPKALAEIMRVLRPGGHMLHLVDYRDHYFRYPFEMLAYSDVFWNWLCPLRGGRGWHNRLRPSEMINLLRIAGFSEPECLPQQYDAEGFRLVKNRLQPRFRNLPVSELELALGVLHARKP